MHNLEQKIIRKKRELLLIAKKFGLTSPEVLKISHELDELVLIHIKKN